jgi:hypothetical protein
LRRFIRKKREGGAIALNQHEKGEKKGAHKREATRKKLKSRENDRDARQFPLTCRHWTFTADMSAFL